MELEIEMLLNVRAALEDHEASCDSEAKAILLNPGNFDLIGWIEVLGLPVLPDERVAPKKAHVLCGVGMGGHCPDGKVFWGEDGQAYVAADPED